MKNFALKVQRFLKSEDGPTAVEYAVMLALIVIVCLTAIQSVGTNAKTTFTNVAASIAGTNLPSLRFRARAAYCGGILAHRREAREASAPRPARAVNVEKAA